MSYSKLPPALFQSQKKNAGVIEHLTRLTTLAGLFHPLGGVLTSELIQLVVPTAELGQRVLAAGLLQSGFGQGLSRLHSIQR